MQRYKLFYNETVLSIVRYEHYIQTDIVSKNCFLYESISDLSKIISLFLQQQHPIAIVCKTSEEEKMLWENIKNYFLIERASGGIVFKEGFVLCIYRLNRWDFPKGHVEIGETDNQAAIREVMEETDIDELSICEDLNYTFHVFPRNNQFILKETHWYKMETKSDKMLAAQKEEGIEKAEWIPMNKINLILNNMYPSLVDLWERNNFFRHGQ